jgi:hypothetical protein
MNYTTVIVAVGLPEHNLHVFIEARVARDIPLRLIAKLALGGKAAKASIAP